MLARDAKIYKDTFTLAETIFRYTGKFDRRFRNSVAQKMEQKVLDLSDIIVRANLAGGDERAAILGADFIVAYEQLQFLINLAVAHKQISYRQQAHTARLMDEIGKQATGWRKSASRK